MATRDAYGKALVELGSQNPRVVALDADLMYSTKMGDFAAQFPDRFFEVGISEADLIGVAAGLASEGFIPFASSFAIFLTGKTYDQVRQLVCYSNNNVKLVATHAGLQAGPDGATHQGLEDIALMRAMPGMTVLAPADAVETAKAVHAIAAHVGPVYMRLGRSGWPVLFDESYPFEIGRAAVLREGHDLSILACGQMVSRALEAADLLQAENISARIVNMSTLKPLDEAAVQAAAFETGAILTVEEHQVNGGLGEAVARCVAEREPVPMACIAVQDSFGESGDASELLEKHGLTARAMASSALDLIRRK
jgi:transketolase